MDRKITELDSVEKIENTDYFVIASDKYDENYKLKVRNFIQQLEVQKADDELSLTSVNPVQNKTITKKINDIDDKLTVLNDAIKNSCNCNQNGDGGNGGMSGDFDIAIADVQTFTANPEQLANVEITDLGKDENNVKSFNFRFEIPRGKDGVTPSKYRTVMAFKTHKPTTEQPSPERPIGGRWDIDSDTITYPDGWSKTDDIERPVWMSTGEFSSEQSFKPIWSEPIMISGEDGVNGVDGVNIEFIFKLTESATDIVSKPESVNETEHVPTGWTDSPKGISEEMKVEWMCVRKKDSFGNWGDWTNPTIWSKWGENGMDGDGIEYIYRRTNGEIPANPTPLNINNEYYQTDGYIPLPDSAQSGQPLQRVWFDNPQGVTSVLTHEWVCVRKQKNGIWGAFSDPALWSKYSTDGTNGANVRVMYAKTSSAKVVPPFTSYNVDPGSIWSQIIPNYEISEAIWSIYAYFDNDGTFLPITIKHEDGTASLHTGWYGPTLVTGINGTPINYKTYVYKLSDMQPLKPISNDPKNPGDNWVDYPTGDGQWWQCIGTVDGATDLIAKDQEGNLLWSEVLPVNGRNGENGGLLVEFRFAISDDKITPSLINSDRYPSGWSTTPPQKTEDQHMCLTTATIKEDNTLYTYWSTPVIISGEKGIQGETGPAGPQGPMGPSGISGIPGVSVATRYCLGTAEGIWENATYDDIVANDIDPIEYGWTETLPRVTEEYQYIWCIQTNYAFTLNNDNTYSKILEQPWSEPFRLNGVNGIDGKGVGIAKVDEYYLVSPLNTGVTINTEGWQLNTIPAYNGENIYLWNYELITYENGETAQPTPPAIIGTKGNDGRGILSIIEKYAASNTATTYPSIDSDEWKESATEAVISDEKPFLWNWERISYTDNTVDDFFAVIGSKGADGRIGQIVYPAGVYSKTTTYSADAAKAPYVFDTSDNNFYVMNFIGSWKGNTQPTTADTPSESYQKNPNEYWTKLESYDAIYANIGVFGNALVGSAVFNGDYMFSQQGKNPNSSNPNAIVSTYQNFKPSTAYTNQSTFDPSWCVNLKTGETWVGTGTTNFNPDGSASLADGNLTWDATGKIKIAFGLDSVFTNIDKNGITVSELSGYSSGYDVKYRCTEITSQQIKLSLHNSNTKVDEEYTTLRSDRLFIYNTQSSVVPLCISNVYGSRTYVFEMTDDYVRLSDDRNSYIELSISKGITRSVNGAEEVVMWTPK